MITCLMNLIVVAIIALVLLWILETVASAMEMAIPPKILVLIRLLAALWVALYALSCFGILKMLPGPP